MDEIFVGRYYPELRDCGARDAPATLEDDAFDVLMLGGSVLTDGFGTIGPRLRQEIERSTGRRVRLYNAANSGLTSRDSLMKYRFLDRQRFDLVVFYHAINEARMNQCPREMFRSDYTHCSWYASLERLRSHRRVNRFVLPYTLEHLAIHALDEPGLNRYLSRCPPPNGVWSADGEVVKTTPSFTANLREILDLAKSRGAKVLLPTYAIHLPASDGKAKSPDAEPDYGSGKSSVETWGTPQGVAAAVREHNAVTRRLAAEYDHVVFVDLDQSMPRDGRHYWDICHLTPLGCERWVGDALAGMRPWLAARSGGASDVIRNAAKPASLK